MDSNERALIVRYILDSMEVEHLDQYIPSRLQIIIKSDYSSSNISIV